MTAAGSSGRLDPRLALIFDMDGVVIDSNPAHREVWAAFNRRFGLETTEAMLQRMYGKRNDEIVRDFFGADLSSQEVARRGAAKERLYRETIAGRVERMLVPGLKAFLREHAGARMALATNAEPENVALVLDQGGIRPYFQAVVDGHQVRKAKPDPEIYRLAAHRLGVAEANCIVFEDSKSGVRAARDAGMRIVGLLTTEDDLPCVNICANNFLSANLRKWLAAQQCIS
ncbi:MAG: HAD-IA family hydrolase [Bryobacteraceae bacterium]